MYIVTVFNAMETKNYFWDRLAQVQSVCDTTCSCMCLATVGEEVN